MLKPRGIYFGFYNSANGSMADSGPVGNEKEASLLVLRVNMNVFNSINTSDPNGANSKSKYLDRTIAHELTHCVMAANINYYNKLPQFIREGMAELTIGADDGSLNTYFMKLLASASSLTSTGSGKSLFDSALDLTNTATGEANAYAGGYMFLRWLAKQASSTMGLNVDNDTADKKITGTDYADIVSNSGTSVTINTGNGDDTIKNFLRQGGGTGNYSSINAGNGNDSVSANSSYYLSIYGGAGNDTITDISGYKNYHNGGAGNDQISVSSSYGGITLTGGTGNDTLITNTKGTLITFESGDGNDRIKGLTATDTLSISGSSCSSVKSGLDIIVTVDSKEKITLEGAASLTNPKIVWKKNQTSNFTDGADTYTNSAADVTIDALGGNDAITNNGNYASILGGAGDDTLNNTGNFVTLSGGDGADIFNNNGVKGSKNVSINGGSGNDRITNFGINSTLVGGAGNDSIINYKRGYSNNQLVVEDGGKNAVIIAGTGNDSIKNVDADNVLFKYDGGNDIIIGFNKSSTLSINNGSGSYSKKTSGKNIIVTVDNNKITLEGAASLSSVNIEGKEVPEINVVSNSTDSKKITLAKGADSVNNRGNKVTIVGASDIDSIWNYGATVSVNGGDGNDYVYNAGNKANVLSGSGNDVIANIGANSTLDGGSGNDSIHNWSGNVKIFGNSGDDTIHNDNYYDNAHKVTIDGGKGSDYISNYGDSVSIVGGAGDDTVYNHGSKGTIKGGSGNDYLVGYAAADKIYGGSNNDKIWGQGGNDVLYGDAGDDQLVGGEGKDKLYGGDGKDSLWGNAGNDSLWGGASDDVFVYTANEGTDRIYDWESGDMLQILNSDGTSGTFKSSKFSGSNLTLTIDGGGKIIFDDVSSSDKFNINGTTYKINNGKLK